MFLPSRPAQDYDVYEKARARWSPLLCKPGQAKTSYRGELEVKLAFTVKASQAGSQMGSLTSLNKRARGSLTSLNRMGGSLLSIGGKERRSITAMARHVGQKVERAGEKAREKVKVARGRRAEERLGRLEEGWGSNRDPGVNSEDEEEGGREDMFQFDRLSHRSSIRSELSLGKLGTVSPAASTPDLEAMRRPAVVGRRWGEVQEEEVEEEWREPEEEVQEEWQEPHEEEEVAVLQEQGHRWEFCRVLYPAAFEGVCSGGGQCRTQTRSLKANLPDATIVPV